MEKIHDYEFEYAAISDRPVITKQVLTSLKKKGNGTRVDVSVRAAAPMLSNQA